MRCCDPVTRAATLLRIPGAVDAALADGTRERASAAAPWGDSVLLLLPPGPLTSRVRQGVRPDAGLEAVQHTATPTGTDEHGRLTLVGELRAVPAHGRRQAALQLWDSAPDERLLDAAADDGWLIAFLDPREACWVLDRGAFPVAVDAVLAAAPDAVLQGSLGMCRHLNDCHPDVGAWLAGEPACFSELDAEGATLLVDDRVVRVPWPHRCDTVAQLQQILRCLPTEAPARP